MGDRRGTLRIYLGAAPGVGKSYAMLNEGWRRASRGTDVVVGYVESHGRPQTEAQVRDLEVIPRRVVTYKGKDFEEMDLAAILARAPEVVLVDELAHTNVPGSGHEKRWQDVEDLLNAGITVVSTLNIQHLESLNDVVERITGIHQRETIPDELVRRADQIELVDMAPEALRRRMAHGNIYAAGKVDAALGNYFRVGNLAALRELALMWVADQVDAALETYRERHGITEPWETRERVVVAVTGAPDSEVLIRRAARMAQRMKAELFGVHVRSEDGLASGASSAGVEHNRELLEEMGGVYHEVAGGDVAAALISFARAENATQLVVGETRRSRLDEMLRGSVINRVVRLSGPIDVHVISKGDEGGSQPVTLPKMRRRTVPLLSPRRRLWGWLLALAGLPVLTLALANLRSHVNLPGVLLLYLLLVVATAGVGGAAPAMVAAVGGFLLANYYFTPPLYTWTVAEAEHLLALVVLLTVGAVVSTLVSVAARRTADASRAAAEADTLARLAGSTAGPDAVPVLLGRLRTACGFESAAVVVERGGERFVEAALGPPIPEIDDADVVDPIGADRLLVLAGGNPAADDRRVLKAFTAQLAAAVERERLGVEAARASALIEEDELRTALLQAVSHDLRTPLASIKAAVSTLRQHDVELGQEDRKELLEAVEGQTDRLTELVTNLLDLSKLTSGSLAPALRPVSLEEVVPAAIVSLGAAGSKVHLHMAEEMPPVLADPALLERVVANLVDNAVRHSPEDRPVVIEAGAVPGRVDVRVVDQGPGIPMVDRDRIFEPFRQLGSGRDGGLGVGLAVAKGFMDAMAGELVVEDTPGGGTTMVVSLAAA